MFNRKELRKGSIAKYLIAIGGVLLFMLGIRTCSSPILHDKRTSVAQGDTLNIAIEISPWGVTTSEDTLSGYYYNLLRHIFATHNQPIVFHPFTQLESGLKMLDDGQCRLVVSDISITSALKEKYNFLHIDDIDHQVLIQLRDSTGSPAIKTQFDLIGKTIQLPQNSPVNNRIHNLIRELGDTIYIKEDALYSTEQLIMLTALGEVPMTVASSRVAESLIHRYPQLDASVHLSFNQFQGWAIAKRDTLLLDSLTQWLSKLPDQQYTD